MQHSHSAAPAALRARRATASLSPRRRVRLRRAQWEQSTVAVGHTRRIPMGATGTPSPAASTTTRMGPARPTFSRSRCAPVRPAAPRRRLRSRQHSLSIFAPGCARVSLGAHTELIRVRTHVCFRWGCFGRLHVSAARCGFVRFFVRLFACLVLTLLVAVTGVRRHHRARCSRNHLVPRGLIRDRRLRAVRTRRVERRARKRVSWSI